MSTDALPLPDVESLPDDLALLKQLVIQLIQELRAKSQEQQALEHRIELLLRRLYGRSSEKLDPRQGTLFDVQSPEASPAEPASGQEIESEETPSDAAPRESGRRIACADHLRQLGQVGRGARLPRCSDFRRAIRYARMTKGRRKAAYRATFPAGLAPADVAASHRRPAEEPPAAEAARVSTMPSPQLREPACG